ncbi:MAG: EAL domain-containing protein, partial [Planctomycetota bacterium]
IIEKGIRQFAQWQQERLGVPRISFNLSMASLADGGICDWLEETTLRHGIETNDICIEILESVILDDGADAIVKNITNLRERGFQIELDDFGSGHASLNTLLSLEVDRIKIDRSLIKNVARDPRARILIEAITWLAGQLKIRVLCEGVEEEAQMEELQNLGRFAYQGFYFAKPMTSSSLEAWMRDHPWSSSQSRPVSPPNAPAGHDRNAWSALPKHDISVG